jgi:hypothetical protein
MKTKMNDQARSGSARAARLAAAALLLILLALAAAVSADDRDLLRQASGKPFVFVIMDTSGSMNWTPPCSHKDAMKDADPFDGMCTNVCPSEAAVCDQMCPDKGCTEFDGTLPDPENAAYAPIIMDNSELAASAISIVPVIASSPVPPSPTVTPANPGINRARANYHPGSDTFYDTSSNLPGSTTQDPTSDSSIIAGSEYWNSTGNVRKYKVKIRFAKNLPTEGQYHVYTYFVERSVSSGSGNSETGDNLPSTNTRVEIEYYDGTRTRTKYTEVDQRAKTDLPQRQRFAYLGTFDFRKSGSLVPAAVTITNLDEAGNLVGDGGQVQADAIAFIPVPARNACKSGAPQVNLCRQPLCPDGDCVAPAGGDDPTSKFFQAKQAMFEVIEDIKDVDFGFGSYEQDNVHVKFKHWRYRAKTSWLTSPLLPSALFNFPDGSTGTIPFPAPGRIDHFGTGPAYDSNGYENEGDNRFDCSTAGTGADDDNYIGCTSSYPADLRDMWEMERLSLIPKLGKNANQETSLYVRAWTGTAYKIYRIDWEEAGTQYDFSESPLLVRIDIIECNNITNDPQCSNSSYSTTRVSNGYIEYDLVNQNVPWHYRIERYPMTGHGFFDFREALSAAQTCEGLEENDDWNFSIAPYNTVPHLPPDNPAGSNYDDAWESVNYAFKRPWFRDPRGGFNTSGAPMTPRTDIYDSGDFIPWDWTQDNRNSLRYYLAPNVQVPATTPVTAEPKPDFRFTPYFHDKTLSTDRPTTYNRFLRLREDVTLTSSGGADLDASVYTANTDANNPIRRRPLIPYGSTPLYESMRDFKSWYDRWKEYARVFDLNWECRPKYVLFLTDGDETCDPAPSTPAGALMPICDVGNPIRTMSGYDAADKVKTFVVGYGLPGGGSALTCMAADGLTGPNNTPGVPILPNNKDELVAELKKIFNSIRTESFAFASASIPAVQSTAADKIYLSSFTPIQEKSIWPGRLDAFRQPLPLTKDRKPDVTFACNTTRESGCHLWDAAERLTKQSPSEADVTAATPVFKLGMNLADNRRIFYGQANPSRNRQALRLLFPPTGSDAASLADKKDMAEVFMTSSDYNLYVGGSMTEAAATTRLNLVVGNLLKVKHEELAVGPDTKFSCTGGAVADPSQCDYVMGDIFHANPSVIIGPNNFAFFKDDLCGATAPVGPNNCVKNSVLDRGYREYVARNVWRRRMLMAATNDGQLHFFDAGVYTVTSSGVDAFTDGTGYELFSYMPRLAMPSVRDQATGDKHVYSLDGTVAVGDAFIDPLNHSLKSERDARREWRTVLIGGMREGGDVFAQGLNVMEPLRSGYFAIDVTQPDKYAPSAPANRPRKPNAPNLGVPTCIQYSGATGKQQTVGGCETVHGESTLFPLELWSFEDQISWVNPVGGARTTLYLDEDDNDYADLGATWSQPVIGGIAVCEGNCNAGNVSVRWVAIFGGGFDPNEKVFPRRGNYIYMVDIENGEVIYKYPVDGAVPSDPAVIDMDGDGLLDVVYVGTTNGYLYKIDLRKATVAGVPNQYPKIEPYNITKTRTLNPPLAWPATVAVNRIIDPKWAPFKILATGTTDISPDGSPIFYPPAMFHIPDLNLYGGLLLVGDREDLWASAVKNYKSRVMVFVDDGVYTSANDIILASRLTEVDYKVAGDPTADYLHITETTSPIRMRGWYMNVPDLTGNTKHWRATSEPFLVAGVAIFSLFDPYSVSAPQNGEVLCQRQGNTFGFSLFVKNGNPLVTLEASAPNTCDAAADLCCGGRCFRIDEFTTAIHTTSTVTKNRPPEKRTDGGGYYGEEELVVSAKQAAMLDAIRDAIMDSMPSSCQYNEKYELSFAVLRNSTGLNELARVPMMVCPGDWKD